MTERWTRRLLLLACLVSLCALALAAIAYRYGHNKSRLVRQLRNHLDSLHSEPAKACTDSGMPILGYAFSRNGRDYTAYLRWVQVHFPHIGSCQLSECRLRFSLERPGPRGFAVRGFGRCLPAPETESVIQSRCLLMPVACQAGAPGPRDPDKIALGVGDLDGCRAAYNDEGCFVNGDVQIFPGSGAGLVADACVSWTGVQGDDLASAEARFRFALHPIDDSSRLKVLRKGEKGDAGIWDQHLALLDELCKPRYRTLTLDQTPELPPDAEHVTVFLRRDMDLSMYGALQMAEYEQRKGLHWSYLVNLASSIYGVQARNGRYRVNPMALENLERLKVLGHEVGCQSDALIQHVEFSTPIRSWMSHELGKLRRAGLPVSSEVANGLLTSFHGSGFNDPNNTWNGYLHAAHRPGSKLCPATIHFENGQDGTVTVVREGRTLHYTLPGLTLAENGVTVNPPRQKYRGIQDVDFNYNLAAMVEDLRRTKPGTVVQILTHDIGCTPAGRGLDLTVDPEYEVYYVDAPPP